jgi:hypothetical protein
LNPLALSTMKHKDNWRKWSITLILRGQQVKRLCFVADPTDCFNLKGDWVVMAHNLDDAGDVEQVGDPYPTQTEAEAEVRKRSGLKTHHSSD